MSNIGRTGDGAVNYSSTFKNMVHPHAQCIRMCNRAKTAHTRYSTVHTGFPVSTPALSQARGYLECCGIAVATQPSATHHWPLLHSSDSLPDGSEPAYP